MKKKLYFEPPKKTNLPEYITIEYGKIRNVNILQLGTTNEYFLRIDPNFSKDTYLPLKNFHTNLKLERIDKYISKQKGLKYTHEIILPSDFEFNNLDLTKVPPSEFILKGLLNGGKIFLKLNFIELLVLDYYSFSWDKSSTAIKISIIGIILATLIAIIIA